VEFTKGFTCYSTHSIEFLGQLLSFLAILIFGRQPFSRQPFSRQPSAVSRQLDKCDDNRKNG
jgi:hypothetical protein